MKSVLAIDEGTTGARALVIAEDGRVLGRGYREIPQHFPRPGWVEHDPEDLWSASLDACREALAQSKTKPDCIGITNQRETVCVWDRKTGKVLHRAIVWQDRRTADRCAALEGTADGKMIRDRTGLVLDPYFSGTKMEWLMNQVPGVRGEVSGGDAVFGTVDAWILYRLTGGKIFATDHTNASRTLLYNIRDLGWDDTLLRIFGVPRHALPEVRTSSGDFGVAVADHFGVEIPVRGVAGDQQAALYGQGCWTAGQAKNTYGTGAFLLLNTGDQPARSTQGLLTTVGCDARGRPAYALEGSVFIAGAAVQWLRDGLGIIAHADETEGLARSVPDTGGVYFVPAFVGLGAPHWEAAARGTIVGLTRGTSRAHLVRAALEAMAFSTKELLDAMIADTRLSLTALQVDGGASANDWMMQFQADLLGVPVARPDLVETTSLGAAGLAGIAANVWVRPEDFLAQRTFTRFTPGADRTAVRARLPGWLRAVDAALAWARQSAPSPS
ncbi:MAG TPA: glycerol kinase GlpK [Gemmatimonadales bacterium]|nr:glycerol kinase GlpK [Gemmatimonadales bacterium]